MPVHRRILTAGLMAAAVTVLLPTMSGAAPLGSSPTGSLSTGSSAGGSSDGGCDRSFAPGGALDTPGQLAFERTVEEVAAHPLVRAAKADVAAMYRADPQGTTRAGQATLEEAVDSIARAGAQTVVTDDPSHPRFSWMVTAPHCWHGFEVHRSGYGIDNPDNVYRHTAVDGQSSFVIHGRMPERRPAQRSSSSTASSRERSGDEGGRARPGLAHLRSDADRSRRIWSRSPSTRSPRTGRPNHIRTTAAANPHRTGLAEQLAEEHAVAASRSSARPAPRPTPPNARAVGETNRRSAPHDRRYWLDWDNTRHSSIPKRPTTFRLLQSAVRASGFATSGHLRARPR